MKTRRICMSLCIGMLFAGFAFAKPEPTPDVTSGQITGILVKKDGGKITVEGEQSRLMLMPHWRGGMPKDGGGFDKEILAKLESFKQGDKVRVDWAFSEHYRIEKIELIQKGESKEKPE